MSGVPDLVTQVWALIEQNASAHDQAGPVGVMHRLCRAAARALPATGVAVSLIGESGTQITLAASAPAIVKIEELQFSLGDGPSAEAHRSRRPVLVADLGTIDPGGWPGYAAAVGEYGVRAVFAFPLQVGAARLGAMNLYRDSAGSLALDVLRLALTFAEVATTVIVDAQVDVDSRDRLLLDAVDNRYQVFQAQGIVMIQLQVSLTEAMARIRAHAYASHRPLSEVADDIVAGRLVLESDAP